MNTKLSNTHPFLCCYAHLSIVLLGPVVDGFSLGVQSIISILNPTVLMISSSSSLWDVLVIIFLFANVYCNFLFLHWLASSCYTQIYPVSYVCWILCPYASCYS